MLIDLTHEARRGAIARVDVAHLPEQELDAARENWKQRMVSEYASARVFGALLGPMMRAGLPVAETRRVAQMAEQEIEHGVLCAKVLASLGGDPVAELPALDEVPLHAEVSPLEGVLRNVISIGCCSETVAVALVGTERELAGPAVLRGVLDRILADEVKHSRFGWRIVARVAPALPREVREGLDEYLIDVFEHQIRFHGPFLSMPCAGDAGLAIGAPHGRSNWLVFVETMTELVVPGLERLGFAAGRAWGEACASIRDHHGD